jgi:hypothetical protein
LKKEKEKKKTTSYMYGVGNPDLAMGHAQQSWKG